MNDLMTAADFEAECLEHHLGLHCHGWLLQVMALRNHLAASEASRIHEALANRGLLARISMLEAQLAKVRA